MLADDARRSSAILLEAPNVCQTEAVDDSSASLTPRGCVDMRTPLIGTKSINVTVSYNYTSYVKGIVEGVAMHIMLGSCSTISFINE